MPKAPAKVSFRDRALGSLLALPFLAGGAYIVGIGLHWVPVDPARVHAPYWVIGMCGMVFVSGGFAILDVIWRRNSNPSTIFGAVMVASVAMVAHWVAFGAGERHFTRTQTLNGRVIESGPIDERTGRVAFGIGAGIADLLLVVVAVRGFRNRRLKSRRKAAAALDD